MRPPGSPGRSHRTRVHHQARRGDRPRARRRVGGDRPGVGVGHVEQLACRRRPARADHRTGGGAGAEAEKGCHEDGHDGQRQRPDATSRHADLHGEARPRSQAAPHHDRGRTHCAQDVPPDPRPTDSVGTSAMITTTGDRTAVRLPSSSTSRGRREMSKVAGSKGGFTGGRRPSSTRCYQLSSGRQPSRRCCPSVGAGASSRCGHRSGGSTNPPLCTGRTSTPPPCWTTGLVAAMASAVSRSGASRR